MAVTRTMSPEAKAASQARMKQFWEDVRAGKREKPGIKKGTKIGPKPMANGQAAQPMPMPARTAPSGPRSVESSPPVLALFQSGSVYILNIRDERFTHVARQIAPMLDDAQSIVVVTPTETRMFDLREGEPSARPKTTAIPQATAQEATEYEEPPDPQDEANALAEEAINDPYYQAAEHSRLPDLSAAADHSESPAARREALNEMRRQQGEAGTPSACGRCRGLGQIMVAMENGQATTAACPVCYGKGQIQRFGKG